MGTGDVRIVITVDTAGQVQKIQDFDKAVEALGERTRTSAGLMGGFEKAFLSLAGQFTVGTLAAQGVQRVFSAITGILPASIKGAMEAEKSQVGLATALELTGRKGEDTLDSLMRFAAGQQHATIYTHEEVESVEALLAQLTSLDALGIQRATRGIIGLAAVLGERGGGLQGAAMMVTKAMEGNYQALRRVGIVVGDDVPAYEKQSVLLDKLEGLYGRATAEAGTFGGTIKQLKNELADSAEELGKNVTKSTALVGAMREAKTILEDMRSRKPSEIVGDVGIIGYGVQATNVIRGIEATFKQFQEDMARWRQYVKDVMEGASYDFDSSGKLIRKSLRDVGISFEDLIRRGEHAAFALGDIPGALEHMKKSLDDVRLSNERFEKTFDVPWIDTQNITEVEAAFKDVEFQVDDSAKIIKGILESMGITFDTQTDRWAEDYRKMVHAVEEETSVWLRAAESMIAFGNSSDSVAKQIGSSFKQMVKGVITGLEELALKEIWEAEIAETTGQAKAQSGALAQIFSQIPFPFSLFVAAGSFALINALFSKILKLDEGGVFKQPTLAMVGHGTEYVLPERKLITIVQQAQRTAPGATSNSIINIGSIHVHTTGKVDAENIWKGMAEAARRRGIRIGRG